ncbi:hypothetical protein AYI70_g2357 [Smittium culicis]|uniref:Uncharacterized protein n=1 Tax=Smittium culicis TaxID=133412 RepID=A0A1R1Y8M3_9FUNG|nr:hypothetical protein AYI70_g2357 [Smittium culicis]
MMSSETVTSEAKDETTSKDDQHISVCSPETVLIVYSELESLIPSIPENSYRAMLTDEEKKKAIYGCPKSNKVQYCNCANYRSCSDNTGSEFLTLERFDEESVESPKRYSDGAATTNIASSAIQAEAQPRGPPDPGGGGGIPTNKESHRGGDESKPRILQKFILHSKEDWGATHRNTCVFVGIEEATSSLFYRSVFAESSYIHKNPASSSELCTDSEDRGISILGRPDNSRRIERSMHETHRAYKFEAYRAGILDKHGQVRADPLSENHTPWYDHIKGTDKFWEFVAQMPNELYRKGTSDLFGAPTGAINAGSTARAEGPTLVEELFIHIDGLPIRRRNKLSTVLEGPLKEN